MGNQDRVTLFEQWAADYDYAVQSDDAFPFDGYERVLDRIVTLSRPEPGMNILDLGTGTGNVAARFAAQGTAVWGLDFSKEMLARAQEKVSQGRFARADLFGPWPKAYARRYDRIVSAYVFHEFPLSAKIELLQKSKSYLQDDGIIVVGDISYPTRTAHDTARQALGRRWDDDEYYWVAEEAVPAAEATGFVVRYEQISSCGGIYVIGQGET